MPTKGSTNSSIDKDSLYGEFQRGRRWRDGLSRKLAHKALDISDDDDMDIKINSGITWKEILAAGAVLSGLGLGWLMLESSKREPPAAAPAVDADTRYESRIEVE